MDRISNLPPEIICKIGSFLSKKEAALTTVLSKSWPNLIPIECRLFFNNSFRESFTDFVDGVLDLQASSRIRLFSVKWRTVMKPAQCDHVNRCICDVLLKRGVFVLFMDVNFREGYALPSEVFTCKTLSKLSLGFGFAIGSLPDNGSLPALKKLYLYAVRFYSFGRCAFQTLLDASPVLEELVIDGIQWESWKRSCTLSSPTLQRLTIRRTEWTPFAGDDGDELIERDCRGLTYDFDNISFDTMALTYLEYSDYVPKEYQIVNLNSLVEAKLNLCVVKDDLWDESHANSFDPMNLINGLRNVEVLDLTIQTTEMLYVFRDGIPVFERLLNFSDCWNSLQILTKNSPNLGTLIIKGSVHSPNDEKNQLLCQCVSECSLQLSCRVKFLRITEYGGSVEELVQINTL